MGRGEARGSRTAFRGAASAGSAGFRAGFLAAALFVRADVAVAATLLALPVCIWCMLGLRRDAAAGEVMDHYVDDESVN
jgi:hypothetical protein